jgi:hypothetical protein
MALAFQALLKTVAPQRASTVFGADCKMPHSNGAKSGDSENLNLHDRFSSHANKGSALPHPVNSLVRLGLNRWGSHLARHYDPRQTLVVSGSPRGGTTWLAESLASLPGHLLLSEPLEPSTHPNILETLGIGYDHAIPPGTHVERGTIDWAVCDYLQKVLAGKVPLAEFLKPGGLSNLPLRNLFQFRRYVVKFIRGNLLLYWLLQSSGVKGVLIIRHPCAVVASQMHFAWQNAIRWRERWIPLFERHEPSLVKLVRSITTDEEVLALDWAVTNLLPLKQPRPHPWLLVAYEEMLEDSAAWKKMCNYLDCPVPSPGAIAQSSTTTKPRLGESGPKHTVEKWKRHLSDRQVDAILRICAEVGVDFYDKSLFPKNLDKYRVAANSTSLPSYPAADRPTSSGCEASAFLTQNSLLL